MSIAIISTVLKSALGSYIGDKGKQAIDSATNSIGASGSIAEYSKSTRTEPICMIDHTIINRPEIADVMRSLTTVYAAMYIQAFTLMANETVGDIKLVKTLNALNGSKRSGGVGSFVTSFEGRGLQLPSGLTPSLESNDSNTSAQYSSGSNYNNNTAIIKNEGTLSTGLLFNVTVTGSNNRRVEVPITVRLLANQMQDSNLLSILTASVRNMTAKERAHAFKSGAINFADVILCRDILREYRKNLIKDKTGILKEMGSVATGNKIDGIIGKNPSISTISNILVVSKDTVDRFERESYKQISNPKVRNLIFTNTNVMILAVVNPDRETVTFYYHDVSVPTTLTFKDIKNNSKNNNIDMMEILRSYQMGNGIKF